MSECTTIPFGPQHPVLPEPIHLDLDLIDEKVVRAVPSIGYIHRGLEKLVETRGFQEYIYVAERVCGICSFGHGWGYAKAVEDLMEIKIPARAEHLRSFWHELSRVHSHLLWLGLMADGLGFQSLFMHAWRLRETVLDIFEKTTGGRVIFSAAKVGGVRYDIDNETAKELCRILRKLRGEVEEMGEVFLLDDTVGFRLHGVGKLTKQEAFDYGCVGPFARASGLELDFRCQDSSGIYEEFGFKPVVETDGDCYARCKVRLREVLQALDICVFALETMPAGDLDVKVKGFPPAAEHFTRVEQPRGEAVYYVKGNKTKNLARFRLRTPTNVNIGGMIKALEGCELADVPMVVLTIDPCVSCCER